MGRGSARRRSSSPLLPTAFDGGTAALRPSRKVDWVEVEIEEPDFSLLPVFRRLSWRRGELNWG